LRDIWRYYIRVASPEIADRIVREIASSAERLGQNRCRGVTATDFARLCDPCSSIRTRFSIESKPTRHKSCASCMNGEIF